MDFSLCISILLSRRSKLSTAFGKTGIKLFIFFRKDDGKRNLFHLNTDHLYQNHSTCLIYIHKAKYILLAKWILFNYQHLLNVGVVFFQDGAKSNLFHLKYWSFTSESFNWSSHLLDNLFNIYTAKCIIGEVDLFQLIASFKLGCSRLSAFTESFPLFYNK